MRSPMADKKEKNAGSSTKQATHVVDYIVQRLADEGITDCFGVPGDYAFPVCDAVDRNPNIRWVGCSNELNASYAADGYARVRGAAMLSTTFAVGELSAINGVMGAKAERSLVYHVVGMPSYQNQRLRKAMHHTFGDGAFENVIPMSARAACCHAVINPDNCMIEMERVIAEARRNNQPAYIVVPSDYAETPVTWTEVRPAAIKSNEASLEKAVAAVADRLDGAKSIIALPAFTLSRLGLQKEAQRAIEALGCPFATTAMEKCIIDESHPQFVGMYAGAVSAEETRQLVEGAELVLDLGGVNLNDENTAAFSGRIDPARFVSIDLNDVRIGDRVFPNVRLADMLAALAKLKSPAPRYQRARAAGAPGMPGRRPTQSPWRRSTLVTRRSSNPATTSSWRAGVRASEFRRCSSLMMRRYTSKCCGGPLDGPRGPPSG